MKYAFTISYDGTRYRGWQSQPGGGTVQDTLEEALESLGARAQVVGAGRTDAGVHAKAQVAHAVLDKEWIPRRLTLAVNAKVPEDISVMKSAIVPDDFHARYSAKWREYRYFIWNAPTCYPHIKPYVLWLPGRHYDWSLAKSAVRLMIGEHDFRAFCRMGDCPERTVRIVRYAKFFKRGPLLMLRIIANSYLTNMIRITVGNLLAIAAGKRDEDWLRSLLEGRGDRRSSARTISPGGLFLWNVEYFDKPDEIEWHS